MAWFRAGGGASIAFQAAVELMCIAACDVAMYGVDRRRLFWWLSMCAILAVISACGAVGPTVSQLAVFVTIDFAMPKDARVDRISSAPTLMFGGMVYFSSCYQALGVYQYEDAASVVFFFALRQFHHRCVFRQQGTVQWNVTFLFHEKWPNLRIIP